jgi:RHH-type transcriptional regulator, rel operon repressor / antitoxin RelB
MAKVLNIRLSDDIAARLDVLAEKTQRPKSFYVKEILSRYLGEYEDAYLALERLNDKNARYYTTEEVEKALDL